MYKSKEYPDSLLLWDAWNRWARPDLFPDYRAREGEWNAYNFRIVTGKQKPNPDGSIKFVKRVKPHWERYLAALRAKGVKLSGKSTTHEEY